MALSDRIAVMYRGQIMEIVETGKASKEYVGLLMAGIRPTEAQKAAAEAEKSTEVERVF